MLACHKLQILYKNFRQELTSFSLYEKEHGYLSANDYYHCLCFLEREYCSNSLNAELFVLAKDLCCEIVNFSSRVCF